MSVLYLICHKAAEVLRNRTALIEKFCLHDAQVIKVNPAAVVAVGLAGWAGQKELGLHDAQVIQVYPGAVINIGITFAHVTDGVLVGVALFLLAGCTVPAYVDDEGFGRRAAKKGIIRGNVGVFLAGGAGASGDAAAGGDARSQRRPVWRLGAYVQRVLNAVAVVIGAQRCAYVAFSRAAGYRRALQHMTVLIETRIVADRAAHSRYRR